LCGNQMFPVSTVDKFRRFGLRTPTARYAGLFSPLMIDMDTVLNTLLIVF